MPQWEYSAIHRLGDAVWRIALLLCDDHAIADRAVRTTFVAAAQPSPASLEHELYRRLLQQRSRRRPLHRHALPRPLRRIAPLDRALLGLWLLHSYDVARLSALTGLASAAIVRRLAQAVAITTNQPVDPPDQPLFEAWLREQLGIDSAVEQGRNAVRWHMLIAAAREQMRAAVGHERLPGAVAEAIERELEARAAGEERHWWQHRAIVIGGLVAAVAALLAVLAGPWKAGAPTAAVVLPTPRELVTTALDRWNDTPAEGTLHRRVNAIDARLGDDEPLISEIWLGSQNGKHRIEVRRGNELVEWQIGDGRSRLIYAANPRWSGCPWPNTAILDSHPRAFTLPAAQQAAIRDERLTLGAYGVGYNALQSALAADDLRSFGVRRDGDHALLTLGFSDPHATPPRRLLLMIDTQTGELRRVQQVIDGGVQGAARDLWRVEVSEQIKQGVSLRRPQSPPPLERDHLLDPACPSLDERHIISLRTQAAARWWRMIPYLPSRLPPGITRGAIVSVNGLNSPTSNPVRDASLLLIGPQRSVVLTQMPGVLLSSSNLDQHGAWRVRLEDRDGVTEGELCRAQEGGAQCFNYLMIVARGWSHNDLLALIDTLQPTTVDAWFALDDAFLDPQPLSDEVEAILRSSFAALQTQPGQTIHSIADHWQRVDPDRPHWNDPYHVPLDILVPEQFSDERWLAYGNDGIERSNSTQRSPDGTLLRAEVFDGDTNMSYAASSGTMNVWQVREAWWFEPQPAPPTEMLLDLLQLSLPISVTQMERELVFEQRDANLLETELSPMNAWLVDLPPGTFARRVVIDRATGVPRREELLHIAADGAETPLRGTELVVWRANETPPATAWALPALPDDTVTFVEQPNLPLAIETALDLTLPQRVLGWPEAGTIRIESRSPLLGPNTHTNRQLALTRVWNNPLVRLDIGGVIDVARYRFEGQPARIAIRQGNHNLLRHLLRHQWHDQPDAWARTRTSQPVTAMIGGELRDGWLIVEGANHALIFEIDDLLLHVSGTAQMIDPALEHLPQLAWQPVEDVR